MVCIRENVKMRVFFFKKAFQNTNFGDHSPNVFGIKI